MDPRFAPYRGYYGPGAAGAPWQAAGPATAVAQVRGGPLAPAINGVVWFRDVPGGTMISVNVTGLPPYRPARDGQPPVGPHGFHIHENGNCQVGDPSDPFQAAGGHWNPYNQPHGHHPGDFPVLFSNQGRTVMIHQNPDDYRTQPAGAAGSGWRVGWSWWQERKGRWDPQAENGS